MKQTAVKWLAKQLESYGDPQVCEITWKDLDSLVEQAKQMEKEQIQDAYNQGYRDGEHDASNIPLSIGDISEYINAEQYYNETFKSE